MKEASLAYASRLFPPEAITFEEIYAQALALGWDDAGVTAAVIPDEDIEAYRSWLAAGQHANLHYMENQLRCAPSELLPGAQSAIIFITYYKQKKAEFRSDAGLVASYARGRDYHHVHRKRLKKFIAWLEERSGLKSVAKGFSDSTPIMERALAVQAGLGWIGKNTMLIHRRFGTFTLLSGVLTTLALPYAKTQLKLRLPRCGTCLRCVDACPTQALHSPYHLDANRCLSYHLIESKKDVPAEIRQKNPGYVFGCDICQDVCPHNVRTSDALAEEFSPDRGMGVYLSLKDVEELAEHPERLYGTPLQRRGVSGLACNLSNQGLN